MPTIEEVERLATRMRDIYTSTCRLTRPKYRVNPNDEKYWTQLAKSLIDKGLDGAHYVRWIYDFYTTTRPTAYPRQIASPKSVQIYLQNATHKAEDRRRQLQVKLDIQLGIVRQRTSLGWSLDSILADPTLEIGTVVRYVLAHHGGLTDLASGLRADAERAIGDEPLYKAILGDMLPLEGG